MPTAARARQALPALFVVCWSSGFVGAELATRADGASATLLAWRFLALAAVLLVVLGRRSAARLRDPRAWWRQGRVAALSQVLYLGLVFESVRHGVPGGTAALVAALQPLLVATVAGRLLGEHASRRQWGGLVLGLVGVVLVVSGDLGTDRAPAWAYLLPLGAMLALTAGTVLERRLDPPETLTEAVTMQAVVTAVAFLGLAVATDAVTPPADPRFWFAVGWLLLLSSLGGYGSYLLLTRLRGATQASTLLYLTPATTMLWVFLMFGEPVPALALVGLAVSLTGVAVALRRRRPVTPGRPRPPSSWRSRNPSPAPASASEGARPPRGW